MGIMLPKLNFIYSYIYDSTLAGLSGKEYSSKTQAEAEKYIKIVGKEFSKYSEHILNDISNISGLKWQKQSIDAYISKYAPYSLSVPLTIKIYKNVKVSTAILVHELVHNIIFQNKKSVRYKKLFEDFRNESTTTKYHVIEGAILYELNKMLFFDGLGGFFEYDNWKSKKAGKEYNRAISIVIDKGPENIIKKYLVRNLH
jgi:hypothetical protein